jgi:U4/U6 small nuclear ribonucleoprotein PRP31
MASLLDDLDDLGSGGEEEEDQLDGAVVASHTFGASSSSASSSSSSSAIGPTPRPSGAGAAHAGAGAAATDLDDLASDDDDDDEDDDEDASASAASSSGGARADAEEPRDAALDAELAQAAPAGRGGLAGVARLRQTRRFQEHMARVDTALGGPSSTDDDPASLPAPPPPPPVPEVVGPLEEWPEYKLVVASNAIVAALDDEILSVHRFLADLYGRRFPELATIATHPLDYARLVKLVRNETDLTPLDGPIAALLGSAQAMVVQITGATTTQAKPPLSPEDLAEAIAAADEMLALDAAKQRVLAFVESRMTALAPNTSALLGTRVAAQLVGIAGGLTSLSRTPSCNVQVLGQKRKHLAGLSRAAAQPHRGVIFECPLVVSAPPDLQRKMGKVLAAKVVLAARVDVFREAGGGDVGRSLLAQLQGKLGKLQEPAPARQKKPLKAPDEVRKKRRGGRQARALKAKFGMTDVRRDANRMSTSGGGDYDSVAMGTDHGMLGTGTGVAGGKLRVEKRTNQKIAFVPGAAGGGGRKQRRLMIGQVAGGAGGGAGGGTLSSVVFTQTQGIELVDPARAAANAAAAASNANGAASGYFSTVGSFRR